MFQNVKVGQTVTILVYAGRGRHGTEWKEKSGRVVIAGAEKLVLNMGGPHGTPGVATAENFVRVGRAKK